MLPTDKRLDAVIVDPALCPGCQQADRGADRHNGYCKACVAAARELSPKSVAPPPDPQAEARDLARRELAERELARRRLLPFTVRMVTGYQAGWFHADLAARLERFSRRVRNGESPRLILNCPPRSGKSELASKSLIAWHLGHAPEHRIISATHSDRLAQDNSRDVLNYIKHPGYQQIFPETKLNKDAQGTMGWRTEQGGMYKPVGAGAGISGYGAHILVIDDPHRDVDAYSQVVRDRIWQWYQSSARTRLMPGAGILVIQTRWVKDDLTGRVLEEDRDGWEVVCYPAEAVEDEYRLPDGRIVHEPAPDAKLLRKKGELLHPERYSHEHFADARKDKVVWAALYQQDPTSGEAAKFGEELFERSACTLDDVPADLTLYQTIDTAQDIKSMNDWSVGLTAGIDAQGVLWLVDLWRERIEADDLIERALDEYVRYHPELVGLEKTNYTVGLKPAFERRIDERGLHGFPQYDLLHQNRDKIMRSQSILARMRRGMVRIPTDAPWYETFKAELRDFPGGKHDDQVDVFSWMGLMLEEMSAPYRGRARPKKAGWRDKVGAGARRKSWRVA